MAMHIEIQRNTYEVLKCNTYKIQNSVVTKEHIAKVHMESKHNSLR